MRLSTLSLSSSRSRRLALGILAALLFHPALAAAAKWPGAQIEQLSSALDRYVAIDSAGGWESIGAGPVIEVGTTDDRIAVLKRRLLAEGDLRGPTNDESIFDSVLKIATQRFQERHGLASDGRVGPQTLKALNVPARDRINQIGATLERLRQMPAYLPARRLQVNVPAAELTIFDGDQSIMTMKVVVGSQRFPTPVLQSRIVAVVFNPPWNIPTRIARNEIVPKLRRDPAYLRVNDIRIVGRLDDPYGEHIDWRNSRQLPALQFQQQPGPKNALGRIKFDIPNQYSVYLHDTPGKSAFDASNRALSHGCVRLQRPEDVARYVLGQELQEKPDLVDQSLATSSTIIVPVPEPLPVIFVYWTAFVSEDGQLQFRDDVYHFDNPITAAALDPRRSTEIAAAPACGTTDAS